jgi:glycosyltransferase involved in cell wall biosynthesis
VASTAGHRIREGSGAALARIERLRRITLNLPRPSDRPTWRCFQAGHREQYGIPRALHGVAALDALITDVWVPPGSLAAKLAGGRLGRRLCDRFHADLPDTKVISFPGRSLIWEAVANLRGLKGGVRTLARNRWWSSLSAQALGGRRSQSIKHIFGYCYESHALFAAARNLGLAPVLGQIDPGPEEDRKVAEIVRQWPEYRTPFLPGSAAYYESWREECRLAGHIMVNSEWSRTALLQTGIEAGKIRVLPLVYTPPIETAGWEKTFPGKFSRERPLRILFLGQCILRKGIAETIEAAQSLLERPVEFTFVGNTDIAAFESHFGRARIRYFPRVSRAECHAFYREADVFLFPTHSDGFGLTQLEAQAWKLPIIASQFCARVVEPGRTGWMLPDVSSGSIVRVVDEILASPAIVARRSAAIAAWPFSLEQLGRRLTALTESAVS